MVGLAGQKMSYSARIINSYPLSYKTKDEYEMISCLRLEENC